MTARLVNVQMEERAHKPVAVRLRESYEPVMERADGFVGDVIRRDLDRHYRLMEWSLRHFKLEMWEAKIFVEALYEPVPNDKITHLLWVIVAERIKKLGLDRKWGLDVRPLIQKLHKADPLQATALVDAAERVWCMDEGTLEERIQAVGLCAPYGIGKD